MVIVTEYSFLFAFYLFTSCSAYMYKKEPYKEQSDHPPIIYDRVTSTLLFEGEIWTDITEKDIEDIPSDVKSVSFFNTLLQKIPHELFKKINNVESIEIHSNYKLKNLPVSFYQLEKVKTLRIIGSINIKALLDNFKTLEELRLSVYNKDAIIDMMELWEGFSSLRYLNISYNKFAVIPKPLYNLKQVEVLNISSNRIKRVSPKIRNMLNLKELDLSNNKIKSFKDVTIEVLKNIETLDLNHNRFEPNYSDPASLFDSLIYNPIMHSSSYNKSVYKLRHLNISRNASEIVPFIFKGYTHFFQNLETLQMSASYIKTLPKFIFDLKKLKLLDIRKNNLSKENSKIRELNIETLLY